MAMSRNFPGTAARYTDVIIYIYILSTYPTLARDLFYQEVTQGLCFDRNGVICVEGLQQWIGIMDGSTASTMTLAHTLYTICFLRFHTTTW
jgi:hypothetical protein